MKLFETRQTEDETHDRCVPTIKSINKVNKLLLIGALDKLLTKYNMYKKIHTRAKSYH